MTNIQSGIYTSRPPNKRGKYRAQYQFIEIVKSVSVKGKKGRQRLPMQDWRIVAHGGAGRIDVKLSDLDPSWFVGYFDRMLTIDEWLNIHKIFRDGWPIYEAFQASEVVY